MAENKNAFNPVKEEQDGIKARRAIWTSSVLDAALRGLQQGKKLIANPFYEFNTKLLKGDLVFDRTQDEIDEWKRCASDIVYFADTYCKLMTPEGVKHVKLRDYQRRYLQHLEKNRLSIFLSCRQSGKTTTSAIFMLHYILFNVDKNALVLGNKRKTAVEILSKCKSIFLELPFFLKPGIYKWNEGEIVLDNGCRLMAEATTVNSGISFTFHCVLADEFAHIKNTILEKFYNNLFPTITAGRARFMITSTQNGYNLFYRLYKSAEAGENEYAPFKVDWPEVPEWNPEKRCWEKRDEAWHRLQVANYGSEEAFNQQFGTNFVVADNTLISRRCLQETSHNLCEFEEKDLYGVTYSENWTWLPDYEPMEELRKDRIILTGDLAEGTGGDYTVFIVHRMIEPGTGKLECVGMYRSNKVPREQAAESIQLLISLYCDPNNILFSYERNMYGDLFLMNLQKNTETHPIISQKFDMSCLVKYYTGNTNSARFEYGLKLTPGNKTTYCKLYKEDFEHGLIINNSARYHAELTNFTNDGTDHFKASFGHDDMVMATIQLIGVKMSVQYKFIRDEYDEGYEQTNANIYNPYAEMNMVPGIIELPMDMKTPESFNRSRLR